MSDLLNRLGRPSDARIVILTCDGLGSSNAANIAVYQALDRGLATSASLQVPCPWARGAVTDYRGEDVGVSLTLNSEYDRYRWGPITVAPSLLDGDGGFPRTTADLWDHADLSECRRELRAQLERAILWGIDVSHLSDHLGALAGRPEIFDVYLDLAVEFGLPMSLPDPLIDLGYPARELAEAEGVVVADRCVNVTAQVEARRSVEEALANLEPGVTELHVRPAVDTPELRAISDNWAARVGDAHLVTYDISFKAALIRANVELMGHRELRAAQRS